METLSVFTAHHASVDIQTAREVLSRCTARRMRRSLLADVLCSRIFSFLCRPLYLT